MLPSCLSELFWTFLFAHILIVVLPSCCPCYFAAMFDILATVGANARYGNCVMDLELSYLAVVSYRRLSPSSVWQIPSVWRRLC